MICLTPGGLGFSALHSWLAMHQESAAEPAACTPAGLVQMAHPLAASSTLTACGRKVPQGTLQRLGPTELQPAPAVQPAAFVMHGTKAAYLTNAVFDHIASAAQMSLCAGHWDEGSQQLHSPFVLCRLTMVG